MSDFGIFKGFSQKTFEGQKPVNVGKIGSVTIPSGLLAYLLDDYSGAAAAYSLRRLSSAYTGSAIRVRRADNNAEQDIGFVNGELDTSSLTTFCSGTDGFVKTWYDQSGNGNDASNVAVSEQPQIVSAGSVILENGKPCVQFDGSDDILATTTLINPSVANPFIVSKKNNDNLYSLAFNQWEAGGVRRWHFGYQGSIFGSPSTDNGLNFTLRDGTTSSPTSTTTQYLNQVLLSGVTNGANMYLYAYSNLIDSNTHNGLDTNSQYIFIGGGFGSSSLLFNGNIQEAILYPSDQSSNRSGIETNINDFYSIY